MEVLGHKAQSLLHPVSCPTGTTTPSRRKLGRPQARSGGAADKRLPHRELLGYFLPLGLFGAWVSTDPANFFEVDEDFGFARTLPAREASFGDDFSFLLAMVWLLDWDERLVGEGH